MRIQKSWIVLFGLTSTLAAQDGAAILDHLMTVLEPENSRARMTQIINTTSGSKIGRASGRERG